MTVGDPAGIGPETVLKALADPEITEGLDITVICTPELLRSNYALLAKRRAHAAASNGSNATSSSSSSPIKPIIPAAAPMVDPEQLHMKSVPLEEDVFGAVIPGLGTAASGEASFRYLDCAIQMAMNGE